MLHQHTSYLPILLSPAFPSNFRCHVARFSLPVFFPDKPISHSDGHTPVWKLISNIKFQDVLSWFRPITLVTLPTRLNTSFISRASVTFTSMSSGPFPTQAPCRQDQRIKFSRAFHPQAVLRDAPPARGLLPRLPHSSIQVFPTECVWSISEGAQTRENTHQIKRNSFT